MQLTRTIYLMCTLMKTELAVLPEINSCIPEEPLNLVTVVDTYLPDYDLAYSSALQCFELGEFS